MRTRSLKSALSTFLALFLFAGPALAAAQEVFCIGVSCDSFGLLNHNDAAAALKVWAMTVARERNLQVEVKIGIFQNPGELEKSLAQGTTHAASMTTYEFLHSGEQPDSVFLVAKEGSFTEQYVVLARRDSGAEDIRALRGRRLARYASPGVSPALPWLETVLAGQNLGRATDFLKELTVAENPSKAVLRVFFRQSDACLVTTNAFALACELNPQLRQQLKVLTTSPPMVPLVFFFHNDGALSLRREYEAAIEELHTTTVGQQVLTVFQTDRMVRQPLSSLDGTRQVFEQFERLTHQTNTTSQPVARNRSGP